MNKEEILQKESSNDGRTVHLYYDGMIGMYVAYGLSAYYVTMVTDAYTSFSDEMGMPLVLLYRRHFLDLRQTLTLQEHIEKQYYRFQLRSTIADAGYDSWKQRVYGK